MKYASLFMGGGLQLSVIFTNKQVCVDWEAGRECIKHFAQWTW